MSAALGLPERTKYSSHPFWHSKEAAVAVAEIDPGFARLREVLPDSWQAMVSAKYCLDAVVAQQAAAAGACTANLRERTAGLLEMLADDLLAVVRIESAGDHRALADQALVAAQEVSAFRATGSWPTTTVAPLGEDGPWLFCGPLAPWAMQSVHEPLTLLLAVAAPQTQSAIAHVDASLELMTRLVADVLGSPVCLSAELPFMRAGDLLLAGGASATGHKHFAHFFPLDALAANASSTPFTLAFANIHRARLARCSLRLRLAVTDSLCASTLDEVVMASIGWFRAHDLSHFWVADTGAPAPVADDHALTPFERITLEEARADVLGLICAAEMFDPGALSLAFSAEMLRYLSRRHREFADSAAAVLELGWLGQRAPLRWADTEGWLEAALDAFRELAPLLEHALQTGSGAPALREAMAAGAREVEALLPRLRALPTDLEYSFG